MVKWRINLVNQYLRIKDDHDSVSDFLMYYDKIDKIVPLKVL